MRCRLISDLDESASADLQDRGLHYGDGLFETMLLDQGEIRFWPEHYRRLSESAEKLMIACPTREWFDQQLSPYFDLQQRLIIKILLTRGEGGRGIHFPAEDIPNIYLLKYEASSLSINQPLRLTISESTLSENRNIAGLKHLNRLDYILASATLRQQGTKFDDALLKTADGCVIEGIIHNLFFVKDGIFFTPDISRCGVDGVMRQIILKNLNAAGKQVKIGDYTEQDLLAAEEIFLCNSVQGIRPVVQIDGQPLEIGIETRKLQQRIHADEGN